MRKNILILVIGAAVVVAVDQITKSAVVSRFFLHESYPVISGFFNLVYVLNPGAAFGFLARASETFRLFFFVGITATVILMILFYIVKSQADNTLNVVCMTLIFSGAVGNLVDRVRFGAVVDFLDFYIHTWHWPAFNVADTAITTGAVLMIWGMIVRRARNVQD
ncbi:MAG TPA: signal peptidase II [Smithella sp.]|nr:signal peptidase II [Smithella sp.]